MPRAAAMREGLGRAAAEKPEYREILGFFAALFAYIDGREEGTGIAFDVLPGREKRTREGFPLLSPESVRVDGRQAARFLSGLAGVMREAGREGKEPLDALDRAIAAGGLDLRGLFAACLARERGPLEEAAAAAGVPATLFAFVLERALRTALETFAARFGPDDFPDWKEPHCPVCGGRPGMAELVGEEGRRFLSCSGCAFRWPYKRLKCPYCGCEEPDKLSYFTAGGGPTRVSVCRKCSRYIKTRDARRGGAGLPLEAEDLTTIHLDLLAAKEGFERGT